MRALLIALIVGLVAYGAGYLHGRHEPVPDAAVVAEPPAPPAAEPAAAPPSATLEVEVVGAGGRRTGAVAAVALGSQHRVVVPLAALDGATAALARTAEGRVPIGPVVAVLPAAGLAALVGPDGGLPVTADSASLHLGLDVKALAGGLAMSGEVESTAMRRDDGSYAYHVSIEGSLARGIVGLTDASGARLIGAIASDGGEAGLYEAVDAGALQALGASDMPPLAVDEFSRRFFTERPEGRLIRFEHAIAAGEWNTAIVLGSELRDLGWSYNDAVSAPLSNAYLQAALALSERPAEAIALLDEAAGVLGESADRLNARARLLAAMNEPFTALDAMRAAAQLDASTRPELRRQMLAVAANGMLPVDDRVAALETAIADDPAYAPYSATLGRLYFGDARYVEATSSFESALAQDPAMGGDLSYMLATARQRLRTPGETIAPLHSSASGMYLYASVDGRAMRFVLDTGASYTALSAQAARALGLGYVNGPQVALSTANGIINAPLVKVNTIDVNGAVVQQIPVVVLDSTAPFDGLLGMSFLDHFDVAIDRSGNRIRLTRR